jgi:hypothetical protein
MNTNVMERFNSYWYLSPLWQRRTGDTTPSLEEATPDRHDRSTSKRIQGKGMRPNPGIVPGQTAGAEKMNDPFPDYGKARTAHSRM